MRNARAAAVVYLTLLVVVGGLLAHQRASAASIRTAAAGAPICRYGVNATGGSDVFTDHDPVSYTHLTLPTSDLV